MARDAFKLPFQEAIDFLRTKLNVPTAAWTDIREAMHARAFVVAGAIEAQLIADFHDAINLKGPYFLTQLAAKQMLQQAPDAEGSRGRIVNITSISVYTASINRGDYCMVKAGLAMMTKLFAERLANDGINVYEIRPGVIATDMTGGVKEKYDKLILTDERGITPIRRWGQPQDIGRAVRAIAEDRFPFSTGAVFDIDGGFHLHRL